MRKINKILIANRGEIAVRIMRTAREMGIQTVAVFSEADRRALHVRMADEAVCIGPAASSESYLNVENIIQAAKTTRAEAIHPGYGFLSENSAFAQQVTNVGLLFIGPRADSIALMGNKLASKEAVAQFNVPLIPGKIQPVSDIASAEKAAKELGYPILIKASSGGGGKGMRVVHDPNELEGQMQRAVGEARSSFSDPSVFIEKYIDEPRHIEFQILGDQQGNLLHLFERECSVQRRHQKVIEEAPSPALAPDIRQKMAEAALNVARSCQYYGAGTVEFIMDAQKNFYFLEMNTRLQVEHPVTEAITGLDLVKLQIEIAEGKAIPFRQHELSIRGHAIESRVYAEDPANQFLPDTGVLKKYHLPQGHGVRVDDGVEQGMSIPVYYDPMISKLICHASSRDDAIKKMIRAINEYEIVGLETTLEFCSFVMQHNAFRAGNFDTHFVEKYFLPETLQKQPNKTAQAIASAVAVMLMKEKRATFIDFKRPLSGNWRKRFS